MCVGGSLSGCPPQSDQTENQSDGQLQEDSKCLPDGGRRQHRRYGALDSLRGCLPCKFGVRWDTRSEAWSPRELYILLGPLNEVGTPS